MGISVTVEYDDSYLHYLHISQSQHTYRDRYFKASKKNGAEKI